jgi:uncharacterized phage protein gp47/JayE
MAFTISNLEIPSLTELNQEDVAQLLERLSAQLQELNPSLDLKRGVFKDTLAYYHAVLDAAIRTNLERYQSARSLQKIQENPELADAEIVNEVLSNWGIVRKEGTKAVGPVTIEINAPRAVVIPQGLVFESGGRNYLTTETFTSRNSENQVTTSSDRILVPLSNGNWAFTITVEAEEIGPDYKLNSGDLILPNTPIAGFVTSYAASSFAAGGSTETNQQLLEELQFGVSAKTLANRTNMRAYLRSIPAFSSVTNQSIIGYGDPEMLRDKHTIFPISFGGRVDWYIRGQEKLQKLSHEVSATCVSVAADFSIWQFSLAKNVFPGFYEVSKIRRKADSGLNSGFEIVLDARGLDLSDEGFVPDIVNYEEGAYTAFQTTTIRFKDTVTPLINIAPGQTANYICEIAGTPHIANIQNLISSREVRSYGADALIKAPIPCFVQVNLTINKSAGDATPDITGIKSAIAAVINQTDFIGRLDGSKIIEAVHGFLRDNLSVTGLDMIGRIRKPDGTLQYIRDSDVLKVPDQPAKMVTAKTVQFFVVDQDITVSVASTIPLAR